MLNGLFVCNEIRSAEMIYALDQISITANDLQKLNSAPCEVYVIMSIIFYLI